MFDAYEQVHGVLGNFQRLVLRLEVEAAEGAVERPLLDEFRIQIEDLLGGLIDDAEIGIAGGLLLAGAGGRSPAFEAVHFVDVLVQAVFKKFGDLIDALELAGG